jgi:hypothetical protein
MSRQKTIRKLSPDDFYNARRYLHERSSFDEIFTALDRILPTLCEAGRLPKDNTGSKGSSSPTATGLQVLSIGGTNAEFDVRLATALCGRRKHVIYNVAETSEAYRQHVDEVLQNDVVQDLLNSRRLQFRDETTRRPRVHRLTDLVIFNSCLHLVATSSPSPATIVLETFLNSCSPDASVVILQQGSTSGFLHVRKRLDFRFPTSLGRTLLTDKDILGDLREKTRAGRDKILIEYSQIDTMVDVTDCIQRTREGYQVVNAAFAGNLSADGDAIDQTIDTMEECCVSKKGDDGDFFEAPVGMLVVRRDLDALREKLIQEGMDAANKEGESAGRGRFGSGDGAGAGGGTTSSAGAGGKRSEWVNEGLERWHKQRAAWRVPKGRRRPAPKAIPYEAVVEGLATLQRTFELPGWIRLPDLIDLYVEIWDMDY